MQREISLEEVKNRIKEGSYTLQGHEAKNAIGAHWNTIRLVFDEEAKRIPDLYACSMTFCNEIIRTNLTKDGTGKLKRHYLRCNQSDRIGVNAAFDNEYQRPSSKKFKSHHKSSVNEAAVSFVVNDMRPIDSVTKVGMVTLLSVFTQIGQFYGKMEKHEVLQLLPSRYTVS